MNFLAHLFLSDSPELMIGNFIADYVKGKAKDNYPAEIKKGIELHRAIDDFTDHHPITSAGKHRLYETQGKYAPVVLDMFYDHFLAKNFDQYSNVPLPEFANEVYQLMQENIRFLPDKVRQLLPYMIEGNWLLNYSTTGGLARYLKGMSKRVAFPNHMDKAEDDLIRHYSSLENEFAVFFPELRTFAAAKR